MVDVSVDAESKTIVMRAEADHVATIANYLMGHLDLEQKLALVRGELLFINLNIDFTSFDPELYYLPKKNPTDDSPSKTPYWLRSGRHG
jgi:hypothetical protein